MKHISAGGTVKMGHLIVVRATWDSETHVWTAESPDLPGLVTEASSLDELDAKLPDLIRDPRTQAHAELAAPAASS